MTIILFRSRIILFVKKGILSYIVTCWIILLFGKGMTVILFSETNHTFCQKRYTVIHCYMLNHTFYKMSFTIILLDFSNHTFGLVQSYLFPKRYTTVEGIRRDFSAPAFRRRVSTLTVDSGTYFATNSPLNLASRLSAKSVATHDKPWTRPVQTTPR